MYSSNKSTLLFSIIIFVLFISGTAFTRSFHQDKMKMNDNEMKMMESKKGVEKSFGKSPDKMKDDDSIVRKGVINLKKIDVNKDNKVFQDMMDYNVISDKAGKCPLCGMTLKEVTLKEAKENLVNAGFKVK